MAQPLVYAVGPAADEPDLLRDDGGGDAGVDDAGDDGRGGCP